VSRQTAREAAAAGRPPTPIPLLSWPEQEDRRAQLAATRTPRLLLLAPGCPPPTLLDELEDWVRDPIDSDELDARLAELARRSGFTETAPEPDVLLDDGILRVGDAWASIPEAQWPIVQLLIDRRDSVVADHEILEAYSKAGIPAEARAVKSMMWRLGRRMATVGIDLHKVRGRGYLVELTRHGE
jgi:hypothetical protein